MLTKSTQLVSFAFIMIFCLNNNNLFSQENYFPDETVWTELASSFGTTFPPRYTIVCGDTTINNILYKKMYNISAYEGDTTFYSYAMREEGQKVWQLYNNNEKLLYDFSLIEGDTFPINGLELIVESVSYETIYGIERKRIHFQNIGSFPGETWYEGIGSNRGFAQSGTGYQTDGSTWICCFKIGSELLYPENPISPCDCTLGSFSDFGLTCTTSTSVENNIENIEKNSFYPNPSTGLIIIQTASNEIDRIEIYSIAGKLALSKSVKQNEEINLKSFKKGIYFVKMIDTDTKQSKIEKLILK